MRSGKERIRRWRERNKMEGKKSVTIVISKKAYFVLSNEKEKTGENFGSIIEKALLNIKRHASLMDSVASNVSGGISSNGIAPKATTTTKQLVDEGDYPMSIDQSRSRNKGIIIKSDEMLNQGFLTRFLKRSGKKLFK